MLNSKTSTRINRNNEFAVYMSWWGMTNLGENGREWTVEEKVRQIAIAGFDGINGFIPSPEEEDVWRRLLDDNGLAFSVNAYPTEAAQMEQYLQKAKGYGGIDFINTQVMTPFLIDKPAVNLLRDLNHLSAEYEIPVFIETHRGTITQDLLRTVDYVQQLGDLPLTIDFSHFVVAGEMHTISDEAEKLLQEVLVHTASIHARVSNGEQVQVDIGAQAEHTIVPHYKRWWKQGMKHWLSRAADCQSFPVVCELGPAPYAITVDEYSGRKQEISDRWQQSLLLKELLHGLWSEIMEE